MDKESRFYHNCKRQRDRGAKCCGDCPFREDVEDWEKRPELMTIEQLQELEQKRELYRMVLSPESPVCSENGTTVMRFLQFVRDREEERNARFGKVVREALRKAAKRDKPPRPFLSQAERLRNIGVLAGGGMTNPALLARDVLNAVADGLDVESGEAAVATKERAASVAKRMCDEHCNECPIVGHPNSRLLTKVLNELVERFGSEAYAIVQRNCPNLTCCYDCHIDDFCHHEGCAIVAGLEDGGK